MISVIVPVYNSEKYLKGCLNSILQQTVEELEIIIVNDGSTDKSSIIYDALKDRFQEKIRIVKTENRGVLQARLRGIREANGEWIGFVDADDIIETDFYDRLLNNAIYYNADISHCGYQTIVNEGERIHLFYGTGKLVLEDREQGLADLLRGDFVEPSLCNKLFNRKLFSESFFRKLETQVIRYNEDLLMNFYLFQEAKSSVYEDFCGYHYLAHSSTATRTGFNVEGLLDPIQVSKQILEQAEPMILDYAWRDYLIRCMRAYNGLYRRPELRKKREEIKKEILTSRKHWKALSRNERIKLRIMLASTGLFKTLYRIYMERFANKVYE